MPRKPKKPVEVPIDYLISTPEKDLTPIEILLNDSFTMEKAVEYASAGFSVSSIANMIGVPSSTFSIWIKKGKQLEEENPNIPEVILWKQLAKGWATAKGLAEAKVSQTDPKFFLTRGPAKLLGDDWAEDTVTDKVQSKETLDVTQDFVTALKALRERGHDLNEIIDNNLLMKVEYQEKPVDVDAKDVITQQMNKALPSPFAKQTLELDMVLDLERRTNE